MNEQSKLGFTYEVTQFLPNGEEKEHFVVHNLVPNEGLALFIEALFQPKNSAFYLQNFWNFSICSEIGRENSPTLYYMTNYVEPHASDAFSETILNTSTYGVFQDVDTYGTKTPVKKELSFSMASDLISLRSSSPVTHTFLAPVLITGVAVTMGRDIIDISDSESSYRKLVSAALFPNPLQMEKNGLLTVQVGFTLISA